MMSERSDKFENGTQQLPSSGLKEEVLGHEDEQLPGLLYRFADSLRSGEEEQEAPEEPEVWLVFRLGDSPFGLAISDVREVLRVGSITRVPDAPFAVMGVTDFRGRVIPIVDIRVRLDLDAVDFDEKTRIIVLDAEGRLIGLLVDAVDRVARILPSQKEESDRKADDQPAAVTALCSWEDEQLRLLDVEQLLSIEEKHPGP